MNEKTSSRAARAERGPAAAFVILFVFASLLLFFRLGERSFRNPDEGRYAEIAREMLERRDFVEPQLYGLDYLKKPPLFYWLVAGSFRTFGFREWAARLVPALAGLLGVLAVYAFAGRIYDRRTAWLAALLLATNFWYVQVSRYLVIDAVFSLLVVVSLMAFYLGLREQRGQKLYRAGFYACLGLAFLAKGPVAIALTGTALLAYAAVTRSFRSVCSEVLRGAVWGVPIFLAVTLPWFLAIIRREPEFFTRFVLHEHMQRFVSKNFEHQEPWFYYLLMLAAMLMPWIFFVRPFKLAIPSFRALRTGPEAYLLTASAAIVVFFSISRSKMPTYIVPSLPLLAILIARGWKLWMDKPVFGNAERAGACLVAALGVAGIIGVPVYFGARASRYPAEMEFQLQLLGAAILCGAVLVMRSIRREQAGRLFYALIGLMAAVSLMFALPMETVNPRYSTQAFAAELRPKLSKDDEVYIFDHPGPFYDFAFYLARPVKIVGLQGEFEDQTHDEEEVWSSSVSREQFTEYLRRGRKLYCMIRKSDFETIEPGLRARLRVIKQDGRKVLFASGGHP